MLATTTSSVAVRVLDCPSAWSRSVLLPLLVDPIPEVADGGDYMATNLEEPRTSVILSMPAHAVQRHTHNRSRLSKQGCPALRRYLYLAALTTIRWDAELNAWHQQLLARGKARKSATCAVAHKLLTRLMARIRDLRASQPAILPLAA